MASDGARVHGFQQRAAPAAVEYQGAAVVGHPLLHVEVGGVHQGSVVLRAVRCHALVVRTQLEPLDVLARRHKIGPVHKVSVAVVDEGVEVDAGDVRPPIPVLAAS